MRIGIIGPSENEIMPFINKIKGKQCFTHAMVNFYTGKYEGVSVVAAFCGVCKVNAAIATQILIDKFDVTHIILAGVAGGLDEKLKVGDVVIGKEIAYHDVAKEILTEYHPWMKDIYFKADGKMLRLAGEISKSIGLENKCYEGRIVSGEKFITENERVKLMETFEPLCVDMESASVAHVCYVNKVPFMIIRSISDHADENGSESFQNNMERVSLNSILFAESLIKKMQSYI